jgi:twinkle protein
MTEVTHATCPYCEGSEFSYNTESGLFYCFSGSCAVTSKGNGLCFDGTTIEPFTHTKQEEGLSLEPYFKEFRGIQKSIMEKHGAYFTAHNGNETVHYQYPDATKHKDQSVPKKHRDHIKISGKMDKFYGQDDYAGGKVLTITEGEEDRLSVIQMMGDWPTVSVPGATPSKEFWEKAVKYLGAFEKIYLSVDNDTAGDKLAETFFRLMPGKVYRVDHGKHKDANDFLVADDYAGYKKAWWAAQKLKPETINTTAADFLEVYDNTPDYEYFKTNIAGLDDKMLGIHKSALTIILAPTGIGKTEFVRYLEKQCYDAGHTFGFCHGEETELRSLLGLVSYELQDNLTRKDLIDAKGRSEEVREELVKLGNSERLNQFVIRVDQGVEDIIEQIRFLVTAMNCDYIFLEPIQDFVSGNMQEKENKLTDLANTMKRLCAELNVGIVIIAHANEDGDAKYCKSLTQSAAYEIVLERDPNAEDEYERNQTYVNVGRKNRTGGGSGPVGALTFEFETFMLTPSADVMPVMDRGASGTTPKTATVRVNATNDIGF